VGADIVAKTSSPGSGRFPVVRIQFRTAILSLQIWLSPVVQGSALAAVIAATAALGYLGINQIGYVRLVGDQKSAVARAERANIDLQDDIANLRDRLAITARDRAVAEDRHRFWQARWIPFAVNSN
jgi:hypothetical protein